MYRYAVRKQACREKMCTCSDRGAILPYQLARCSEVDAAAACYTGGKGILGHLRTPGNGAMLSSGAVIFQIYHGNN